MGKFLQHTCQNMEIFLPLDCPQGLSGKRHTHLDLPDRVPSFNLKPFGFFPSNSTCESSYPSTYGFLLFTPDNCTHSDFAFVHLLIKRTNRICSLLT